MAKGQRRAKNGRTEYLVFVSHATADKWIAKTICERLEAMGLSTFRDDRDIDGGGDIPDSIKRKIAECDELLVLLTPRSAIRPWVLIEVGAAWILEKHIVPVRYHLEVDSIPEIIKSKKSIDLNDIEQYFREVVIRAQRKSG